MLGMFWCLNVLAGPRPDDARDADVSGSPMGRVALALRAQRHTAQLELGILSEAPASGLV